MSNEKANYKPILFSTPMVQALLNGSKTQTRRIIKPQPIIFKNGWEWKGTRPNAKYASGAMACFGMNAHPTDEDNLFTMGSRIQIGDILWVRETFGLDYFGSAQFWHFKEGLSVNQRDIVYKADDVNRDKEFLLDKVWKPSIFMPKKACRLFLEVTNVRVERLQDISEADAKAEGVEVIHHAETKVPVFRKYNLKEKLGTTNPILSFETLWESINNNWKENPFVWAYEFKIKQSQ